ncbi:putative LRR receptor-like serine/threonine-protein kinase [Iris pallida]|uniref:LRR receptor-like serine/threonine-protein kinase n=1 Tax=Iris pallida TaxID=29817 RepID=A0AAX6FYK5_IRIPA|nr:putative LRR receptor-like serine/threonine-protein kinase [Iris pallida]
MARRHLLLLRNYLTSPPILSFPKPLVHHRHLCHLRRHLCSAGGVPDHLRDRILLLTEKPSDFSASIPDAELREVRDRISLIAVELLSVDDVGDLAGVLEAVSVVELIRRYGSGLAFVELLSRMKSKPQFALEVFNWRRKLVDEGMPMLAEEYSKAISLAGRAKNVDLAASLFYDARVTHGMRSTCLYNALMAAYMYNGYTRKCVSVFEDLKKDPDCNPTIVTYNILLSLFGRSMLVNHMESVLQIIDQSDDLSRNLKTYNTVIAAYVTAWMWDQMESTFRQMETSPIQPDSHTHLLMLRGYAHSGNLERMEETYELVRELVSNHEVHLVRVMICAYCKSSHPDRIKKVEALAKFIPEEEYRPWLNVLMIRVYAQEGLIESMDHFISQAFTRDTMVTTSGIMRSIISGYFQCGAVDRLAMFVRKAEQAGWRICRSLYHCKMVMYGRHNRLEEMHGVLDEMEVYKLNPTKKTYLIMFKAYLKFGRRFEAESVLGMMWKHGFGSPEDAFIV